MPKKQKPAAELPKEFAESKETVLIDFHAEGCPPCIELDPAMEKFRKESGIKVLKIDIDKEPKLAKKFKVVGTPTVVAMKCGREVARDHCNTEADVKALVALADKKASCVTKPAAEAQAPSAASAHQGLSGVGKKGAK